jgi:hypothetical protein
MAERPSKATILAARESLMQALKQVRQRLPLHDPAIDAAWAQIETFCAISLRVMAKTNMSKLIDETRTVEISARLAGRPVLDPD